LKAENTEKKIVDYQILKRLFGFLLPYKSKFTLLVFLIIIGAILAPALPLMIQTTIDGPIASGNYSQLALYLGIMVVILISNAVISYFNTYEAGWLSQQIIHDIRKQVFQKIIHL
jgi:ATP-binding cassette subfamily B protein